MNTNTLTPDFNKFPMYKGKPKTPNDWDEACKLYRQMGYEMLIAFGTPPDGAAALADLMFSGPNARAMLEMGFDIAEKRNAAISMDAQK